MKEFLFELWKAGHEKLKYPILTVYIIILILWNWDVLSYYILSEKDIEVKIDYIKSNFTNTSERIWCPLVKAIFLAILFPLIMWLLEKLLFYINNGRRGIRSKTNEKIRTEKLAIAKHEYEMQQERTGKKTTLEWETKVNELQAKIDIQTKTTAENSSFYQEQISNKEQMISELKKQAKNVNSKTTADFIKQYQELHPGEEKRLIKLLGNFLINNQWHAWNATHFRFSEGDEELFVELIASKIIDFNVRQGVMEVTNKGKNVYQILKQSL